jgi:hypothetical protein
MSWTHRHFVLENGGMVYGISKAGWGCDDIVLMPVVLGHEVVGIVANDGLEGTSPRANVTEVGRRLRPETQQLSGSTTGSNTSLIVISLGGKEHDQQLSFSRFWR